MRDAIVRSARGYLGAPYRRCGSLITGMDCIGLLVAVGRDVGALPPDFDPGPYDRKANGTMEPRLRQHLTPISPKTARPGDVLMFRVRVFGAELGQHIGILETDAGGFIHASSQHGRVLRDVRDHNWPRTAAWSFPGVNDG